MTPRVNLPIIATAMTTFNRNRAAHNLLMKLYDRCSELAGDGDVVQVNEHETIYEIEIQRKSWQGRKHVVRYSLGKETGIDGVDILARGTIDYLRYQLRHARGTKRTKAIRAQLRKLGHRGGKRK